MLTLMGVRTACSGVIGGANSVGFIYNYHSKHKGVTMKEGLESGLDNASLVEGRVPPAPRHLGYHALNSELSRNFGVPCGITDAAGSTQNNGWGSFRLVPELEAPIVA